MVTFGGALFAVQADEGRALAGHGNPQPALMEEETMDKQRSRFLRAGLALPISAALLLGACSEDDSAGPDAGVTVSDLEDMETRLGEMEDRVGVLEEDLAAFGDADVGVGEDEEEALGEEEPEQPDLVGQTVTVSGEVTSVIAPTGFTISGEEDEEFDELAEPNTSGVLVVSAQEFGVTEGDVVQIVGEVALFSVVDVEAELGIALDDELFEEFEGQPALIADSVDMTVPEEGD